VGNNGESVSYVAVAEGCVVIVKVIRLLSVTVLRLVMSPLPDVVRHKGQLQVADTSNEM